MNAVSLPIEADEPCPPTERAPASGLAVLLARIREEETLTRTPSFDLLARSTGADGDAVARMRAHYANGETAEALAVAASIGACLDDGFGGLIPVTDEDDVAEVFANATDVALFTDDEAALLAADIEEIDSAFLELDLS